MPTVRLRRRLVKWGSGYGIRLTKKEVERLQANGRTTVDVEVRVESLRFDAERFRYVSWGRDASERHTELAAEAAHARG